MTTPQQTEHLPASLFAMLHSVRITALSAAFLLSILSASAQDYRFDGSMPRAVLESYLDRSISYTELLHDDLTQPRNSRGVDPRDNLRFIAATKAKFIGRALMV